MRTGCGSTFAGHRLIVAHDPLRAAEQGDRRRARIAELDAMAEKMVAKLDAQDEGQTAKGRRASDRGAYSRFTRAVADAEMTRFIKADLNADRFSWTVDDAMPSPRPNSSTASSRWSPTHPT